MNYSKTYLKKTVSIQEPIPGRSQDMKKNLAGGYAFKANDLVALRRWLLTGSMTNAFYEGSDKQTEVNIFLLTKLVESKPNKVAEEIVYASTHGTRASQSTSLLALVYLSMGNYVAKAKFREIFNSVVRTASFLYEFLDYVKNVRGMGKVIHKAVLNWLNERNLSNLEYQFLKYQQREGWAAKDVLRLVKPVPQDSKTDNLYAWVAGKTKSYEGLKLIPVYEELKKGVVPESSVVNLILEYGLTHEMIPANVERTTNVWEALFQKMPVEATIRNLGNLTSKGIFNNVSNLDILENRLSKQNIARAHVHPLNIAVAGKFYELQGMGGKTSLTWNRIPRVVDIINNAIDISFETIEPTGKIFFHSLDISNSMTWENISNLHFRPLDVEAIMALATIKAEKNYYVGGFSNSLLRLDSVLNKSTSFSYATSGKWSLGLKFGGTDASLTYKYATENKLFVDTFISWTDNESWMRGHPAQALNEYRSKVNSEAKAIYVSLTAYGDSISLADPKDSHSYDIVGFSTETPKLIQMIAKGDF